MKRLHLNYKNNKQTLISYALIVKIIVINTVFKQEALMKQKLNFIIV